MDTGGTFSDVVLSDDRGGFSLGKAPTTPDRIYEGISGALASVAEERGGQRDGRVVRSLEPELDDDAGRTRTALVLVEAQADVPRRARPAVEPCVHPGREPALQR